MSTNYPTSIDDGTTLPNPSGANTLNSPDHASIHANGNDAIKAVEGKVGTGSSTPANNTFLIGNGTGTSAWSSLTSAQLASRISDETGSGAAVFANTPTLVTPKADTINEVTPANGVTVDGLNIKDGALNTNNSVVTANITDSNVTTAKIADDAVTAAKMLNGIVKYRRGGTSGDASWSTNGTTNTDTSSKDVFIQVGFATSTTNTTNSSNGWYATTDQSVTFPTPFNQPPLVFLTSQGDHAVATATSVPTTTAFTWKGRTPSSLAANVSTMWIAIGQ